MTLPKESASPVLTVLVADQGLNQLPMTRSSPTVSHALRKVILALRRACKIGACGPVRILTGVSHGAEDAGAAIAAEEKLPLHLLSSGCPFQLSGPQARAERQVWLGADSADCLAGEPDKLRNEIALGFTDVLLLVWDSASVEGLNSQGGKLLLAAVLAMKPVILVDLFGSVRILDRTTITQQRRHLLQCPQPSYQILLESFSVALDGEEIDAQMELIIGAMGVVEHPSVTEKQVPSSSFH